MQNCTSAVLHCDETTQDRHKETRRREGGSNMKVQSKQTSQEGKYVQIKATV